MSGRRDEETQLKLIFTTVGKQKVQFGAADRQALQSIAQTAMYRVLAIPIGVAVGSWILLSRTNLPRMTGLSWTSTFHTRLGRALTSVATCSVAASMMAKTIPSVALAKLSTLHTPLGMITRNVMAGQTDFVVPKIVPQQHGDQVQAGGGFDSEGRVYEDSFPTNQDQQATSSNAYPSRPYRAGRPVYPDSTAMGRNTADATDHEREQRGAGDSAASTTSFYQSSDDEGSSSSWRDDDSSMWSSRGFDDEFSTAAQSSSDDDGSLYRRDEHEFNNTSDDRDRRSGTYDTDKPAESEQQPRRATRRRP